MSENQTAVEYTGFANPVLVALAYLRSTGITINEASFDRLAKLRGDAPLGLLEDGFVVRNYDDLQRLCDIAEMVIFVHGGTVFAYSPEEWEAMERKRS